MKNFSFSVYKCQKIQYNNLQDYNRKEMIVLKKNYIRKIFAAFMAAAVMSSFSAVSICAEPDMVVEDEAEADLTEEEQEDEEQETPPDEEAGNEATDEENSAAEDEGNNAEDETNNDDEDSENNAESEEENNPEDYPTDDDLAEGEAPSLPEPTYTATGDIKMYATTTINVRKGPGTGYDKLGVLYANGETTVKGYNGEWMAIDYFGNTGYVLGELLTETAPVTTTTTQAPVETAPEVEETVETTAETEPVTEDTTVTEEEPVVVTTSEETAPTTQPVEETDDKEDEEEAAAVTDSTDKKNGGLQGILIAAICALAAFLLIGVLPIVIHRIHHKKLYQY